MPLRLVPPSPEVLATYAASLDDFFGPHKPEVQLFHLPVATLGLGQLANGSTLKDATPSGCRFVASWPDQDVTSCEMTNPALYGQARFRNIVQGDFVHALFTGILESQGLDAVQTADFELHFLSIPAIHFEGLHLVSNGPANDLVRPVLSWDLDVDPNAVLDADAFLALVRPIAAARLAVASSDPLSC